MNLPSKKFIVVVVGTIVVGTGLFSVLTFFKKEIVFTQGKINTVNTGSQKIFSDPSAFGNFTSNNSASFGVSGPQSTGGAGNLTELFSQELITELLVGGNTAVDETEISKALNALFEESAMIETPRIYSQNNIRITGSTKTALKRYGNELMVVITKYPRANATDTLSAFEILLEEQDANVIKTLALISEEYRKMESDTLSIPTPREIVSLHLEFVNILRAIGNAVTDMEFALTDPVRATLGLTTYVKQLDRAWILLTHINKTFETTGISFSKNETGYAWKNFNE